MEGGGKVRDHLKLRNPSDPRLKEPELDAYDLYILAVFRLVSRDRPPIMQGLGPLTLQGMLNYMKLCQDELYDDEIHLIFRIDDLYRQAILN